MTNATSPQPGHIVLADGTVFAGEMMGAPLDSGYVSGEFVFNTVMSGYQEVITDPSYAGQIIAFTATQIGNYGTVPDDAESTKIHSKGVIVRQLARHYSNWRATQTLEDYLGAHNISGMTEVDTRALTRHLRTHGALPGVFGSAPLEELKVLAQEAVGTDGVDWVSLVTTPQPYELSPTGEANRHIVAMDFGVKSTILDHLRGYGKVTVVPSTTSAEAILALNPDGVFLSNGPGDPDAVAEAPQTISNLLGEVPIFGICMGHQLLAKALGGSTYKLTFGHHGGNHPVRDLTTGKIEITSQNHNYCVDVESLDNVEITHRNLNDDTIAGFASTEVPAFGVQHHPEAGPGPRESSYLFSRFVELIDSQGSQG